MATLQPGEQARMYALGGLARGGATRGGYVSGQVFIKYGGVQYGWGKDGAQGVLIGSLSITQELDETPDTCRFTVNGGVPSIGDEVILTLGSKNATMPLYAGYGLTVTQTYVGDRPANVQAAIACVDYTWQLGFVLVTAQYRNLSAGAIVQDLVSRYAGANGFTATAIDPNLTTLDEITFTNEDLPNAITRTMRRAGGYWYVDYTRNIHAFLTETGSGAPEPLTPAHKSLADVTRQTERTQVLSRVYVEGRGSRLLGNVAAGDTLIPVDAVDMFAVNSDVFLKASFQGAEGGAQHLNFSGVVAGGAGSVVGPGMGPTSAPVATPQSGSGIESGTHSYAYTFQTAAGESLPSAMSSVNLGGVGTPTEPIQNFRNQPTAGYQSQLAIGDIVNVAYAYSTMTDYGADIMNTFTQTTLAVQSPSTLMVVQNAPYNNYAAPVVAAFPYTTDTRVKWICVWLWSANRGSVWQRATVLPNAPEVVGGIHHHTFGVYGSAPNGLPSSDVTATNQVALSSISVGTSGVTARKLYRTAANQAALKLLTTIANNTATTYVDAASDGTLGAAPPATDTSGLQQPAGQVLSGATSIPVASLAGFQSAGGWAIIGNGEQVIRYTGLSGITLTGIPPNGTGAITATISYNSTITAAPMLTGIPASGPRAIVRPLTAGDEIYLVVQVDDTTTQSGLAADVGGAGIREEWVQDRRLSVAEARARGRATLALRPLDSQTLGYRCRDLRTAVGKFVTASLPAPTNIIGDYRILAVTIDNFRPRPTQYPTFTVRASSTHFSFDDWLRRMRTEV